MENYINEILKCKNEVSNIILSSLNDLEEYRIKYLGSKGEIKRLFNLFKSASYDTKRELLTELSNLKDNIESIYQINKEKLKTI